MSETELASETMVRRPYQSVDNFEAEQENIEVDDKGYALKVIKPQEQTLEEEIQEELSTEDDDSLEPEEKTYKKRYGDLRRHSQEKLAAETTRRKELEEQLKIATTQQSARSMDDEALDSFAEENPEAAEVFTNLAQRETEKSTEEMYALKAELAESRLQTEMKDAKLFVKGDHADIDDITDSDEFHDWAASQSDYIQKGIYENPTDGVTLSNIISSYKAQTGISTETSGSKRNKMKEAASELVETKGKSEPGVKEKPVFSAKAIGEMKIEEYEKIEDEILLAREEGRIVA